MVFNSLTVFAMKTCTSSSFQPSVPVNKRYEKASIPSRTCIRLTVPTSFCFPKGEFKPPLSSADSAATYHLLVLGPRAQGQLVLLHVDVDEAGVLEQTGERRPRVDFLAELGAARLNRRNELVDE